MDQNIDITDFQYRQINDNQNQENPTPTFSPGPADSIRRASIMGLVSRAIVILIISHVVYLALDDIKLFSFHPACMIMGFLLFMMEAILSLSDDILPVFKNMKRTTTHWILQVTATSFIAVGFLSIFINKYKHDYPHFKTWHGYSGLITVGTVCGTNLGGTAALYSLNLKHYIKPALLKAIHSLFGVLAFFLGIVTLVLGFYSAWFVRNANEGYSLFYSFLVIIIGLRVLVQPLKNIAARFKSA